MCNFIIRPIKSICTVDIRTADHKELIKRGDGFNVKFIEGDTVVGDVNDTAGLAVPLSVFIHAFTADPETIKKMKKEEIPSKS